MRIYKIYKITNSINGKVYIGKTIRGIKRRWKEHCYAAKGQLMHYKLHDAILKYGPDKFTIECIDEAKTDEEACEKEIYWIKQYNSLWPAGYNGSKGGKNSGHMVCVKNATTGEVFESITEAAKVYERTDQAIRQALDKPNKTCAGHHWITIHK